MGWLGSASSPTFQKEYPNGSKLGPEYRGSELLERNVAVLLPIVSNLGLLWK
jgi:hypothetical protein